MKNLIPNSLFLHHILCKNNKESMIIAYNVVHVNFFNVKSKIFRVSESVRREYWILNTFILSTISK